MREKTERILQENKEMREKFERILQDNKRIFENNNRINNETSERLFDSFQESINNDENIKKLEEIEFNEQFKNKEENKCTICLKIFSIGDKVSYLPCFHCFHSSCIKNWIRIKNKCPLCKNIIIS